MARIHTTAIGPRGEIVEFIDPETSKVKTYAGGIKNFRARFVTITTTPQELLSGETPLEERVTLVVVNDSSNLVYIRIGAPPDLVNGNFLIVFSGQNMIFTVEKDNYLPIYGVSDELSARVRVIEVS